MLVVVAVAPFVSGRNGAAMILAGGLGRQAGKCPHLKASLLLGAERLSVGT